MNSQRLHKLGAISCGVIAAAVLFAGHGCADGPELGTPDETAVKEVISQAELLMAKGGATADYAPTWLGGPMTAEVKATFQRKVAADLKSVFSAQLADAYQSRIEEYTGRAEIVAHSGAETTAAVRSAGEVHADADDTAAAPPSDEEGLPPPPTTSASTYPIVRLDGGVNNILFSETTVTGDTAVVTGTVDAWAKVAQIRDGVAYPAYPHNIIAIRETLQRQGDKWLVTDRQWEFAPGGGP